MLNRARLFDALALGIGQARAADGLLGVLVLRTQRMREFDLLFGYEAGERVAVAMQAAIASALRPVDALVRIGDCDFAVLLPGLQGRNHAALAAAKLARVLAMPLEIEGQQVLVSIAIGAAVFPEDGGDAELLCRHADIACGEAMANNERYALYSPAEVSHAFHHGELREAIANNGLKLYFQPVMRLRDGCRFRVEALSRWTHPEFGVIAPQAFIHVAEQTGLIAELTRWNLNAALRHAALEHEQGREVELSVNLSVGVLQQPSFIEQVLDMLQLWSVPAESVVLEVTESALMGNLAHCERMLRQLRGHGFGIAIDDFGTGYSSMAYLTRLPVTELKIDKSFVLDMRDDPRAAKLVRSMIDLSHHLGVAVVAEGVENAETLSMLREMGCDHAQGYHLGRPLPAIEALAALAGSAPG